MAFVYFLHTLWVENLAEIALFHTVKEIRIFCKNSKMQNRRHFGTCLEIGIMYSLDTPGVKNFDKIALSITVKEMA